MADGLATRKVVLVGPTHPYTGGIAQHTTRLALELEQAGTAVTVESWKSQYPKALYKGPATLPASEPEIGIASSVVEKLAWYSPRSWWSAGRRSRKADAVAFSIPTPFHAVPYLLMLSALGRRAQRIAIVHNVLPHEPGPLDRLLMGILLRRFDRVIVHNTDALTTAQSLGVSPERLMVRSLPSPWYASEPMGRTPPSRKQETRLLFFGTIRHYKGLDILLKALARTPNVTLTIAGEFWEPQESYLAQIDALGLGERVTVLPGYVAQSEFSELFGKSDVLVLPYRSGTGSIVRELGFRFGLPVIASDAGSIAEGIEHGINGEIVSAGSVDSLVAALSRASDAKTIGRWRKGVARDSDRQDTLWALYREALR